MWHKTTRPCTHDESCSVFACSRRGFEEEEEKKKKLKKMCTALRPAGPVLDSRRPAPQLIWSAPAGTRIKSRQKHTQVQRETTTLHAGARQHGCLHIPGTARGILAHYKYVPAWPRPLGDEAHSRWWIAEQVKAIAGHYRPPNQLVRHIRLHLLDVVIHCVQKSPVGVSSCQDRWNDADTVIQPSNYVTEYSCKHRNMTSSPSHNDTVLQH